MRTGGEAPPEAPKLSSEFAPRVTLDSDWPPQRKPPGADNCVGVISLNQLTMLVPHLPYLVHWTAAMCADQTVERTHVCVHHGQVRSPRRNHAEGWCSGVWNDA